MASKAVEALLERHRSSGRFFSADGIRSFVLDEGPRDAPPVVCIHGVPASSFLFRKTVPALTKFGLRGIAIDLPGLGLAERPAGADYTWTGLGRWMTAAIDALELERFHLVVHDIGGPIGFEVAHAIPDRVQSLTLLNTVIDVATFHRPWPMEPFAHKGIGEAWLQSLKIPGSFVSIMRLVGVSRHVTTDEILCWKPHLFGDDDGRAFLEIMRGFELTAEKQALYRSAVGKDRPYPVQIVWGDRDTMLRWGRQGAEAQRATGLETATLLPAKHFVPEDQPVQVASAVHELIQQQHTS
ncbi:alpha/beta fold hydrolase [Mycolicibacterium sp.]|uniref:alpha/beta fold hydrolase n=1 Tax=Mycolicibacterium sp. TaxID=2320850 RepID=UPI003D0C2BDD